MAEHTVSGAARTVNTFVPLTIKGDTAVVHLSRGARALIDLDDWGQISKNRWTWHPINNTAYRTVSLVEKGPEAGRPLQRDKRVLMHRQIMGAYQGIEVDHKDLDTLNNRRSNLRLATSSEQKRNQRLKSNNTSGVKGVTWSPHRNKWTCYITHEYKRVNLGYYDTLETAAAVRKGVAKFLFKEFHREGDAKRAGF